MIIKWHGGCHRTTLGGGVVEEYGTSGVTAGSGRVWEDEHRWDGSTRSHQLPGKPIPHKLSSQPFVEHFNMPRS
ncbi:hypothetical protein FQN60_004418 [Etheostoma spectabile]|uniref:Uncharacterized protein n=1 Tax=Etheostoma spectabile TaxID=54343 RepID=A0A5J5CX59_9PERO|nr:hypothetical protein FQN60_004418 [Etheostoma spectabile]